MFNHFGDVWPVASLLHDIGYILEGTISAASAKIEHERISNGAKVIHDYFNHWFFKGLQVDFRAARNIAKNVGCVVPDFKASRSLPSLANHLCDIGSLENIRKKLLNDGWSHLLIPNKERKKSAYFTNKYELNLEAFKFWKLFYQGIDSENNQAILEKVNELYQNDVWCGDENSNIILNHGVCGGLILLQASTFFHELMWGLDSQNIRWCFYQLKQEISEPNTRISKTTLEDTMNAISNNGAPCSIYLRGGYNSKYWIQSIWTSASVAIHDYITKKNWNPDNKQNLRIKLNDDPLGYLGVLVDLVQEWDRYTILGVSAFSGKEPLQSYETMLQPPEHESTTSIQSKIRIIYYPKEKLKDDIEKKLTSCLEEWRKYLEIQEVVYKPIDQYLWAL